MSSEKCFYQSLTMSSGLSHGLGDLIRGMLVCSKICHNNDMKHIVLTKEHPIGVHLEYDYDTESIPKDLQISDNPVLACPFVQGMNIMRDIALQGTHKIYTNFDCSLAFMPSVSHLISQREMEAVKKVLIPNQESKAKLDLLKAKLPPRYEILHFRFGDSSHGRVSPSKIKMCREFILRKHKIHSFDIPLIVCCDSDAVKRSLPPDILVVPINPVHVGNCKEETKVLDTLLEYWIIASSEKIISYTVYSWVSGFVRWVSWLNGIPLEGYVKFLCENPSSGNKVK